MCFLFSNLEKPLGLSNPADKPHIGNRNGTFNEIKKESHNEKI